MPAPLAGIVPILMNSARGLKILRDLGIAVTSIPAIEKTINAIPEEKQKQLVELIVQGPAYDFVNEQVFRNVKDTPSGTVIGPDADEIEKQKEEVINKKTYILKDKNTGYYKIGRSSNPLNREKTLQSEKPTYELIKIFNNDIETKLHKKYNKQNVRGEWFDLSKIQLKYICTNYK